MPGYSIDRRDRVFDWIEAHPGEPERCDALLVWLRAVCNGPVEVSSGYVIHEPSGKRFYFADVPLVRARVTYMVIGAPARCVRILRIADDEFEIDT